MRNGSRDDEIAFEYYHIGKSQRIIASRFSVSTGRVGQIVSRAKYRKMYANSDRVREEEKRWEKQIEIERLAPQDLTVTEIAKRVGCSFNRAARIVRPIRQRIEREAEAEAVRKDPLRPQRKEIMTAYRRVALEQMPFDPDPMIKAIPSDYKDWNARIRFVYEAGRFYSCFLTHPEHKVLKWSHESTAWEEVDAVPEQKEAPMHTWFTCPPS